MDSATKPRLRRSAGHRIAGYLVPPAVLSFAALLALTPAAAGAQDTLDIIGSYRPGVRPTVLILPVDIPNGDSIRAILQRDLDFGDRVLVNTSAPDLRLPARGEPDYAVFAQLGINAFVHVIPTPTGIEVALHSTALKRIRNTGQFPLPARANAPEWRMALHMVSDEVQHWLTTIRGIAATRVLFVRNESIYSIDSDGANEHLVEKLEGGMGPTWHPNGSAIAFAALRGNARQIGVKELAPGGRVRWLTNQREGSNLAPAFSHDGRDIFFSYTDGRKGNLWAVPFSGNGAVRTITRELSTNAMYPSPSPNGRQLVFATDRLGNSHPFVMNVDGTDERPLFDYVSGAKRRFFGPQWSPDGSMIAYTAEREGRSQIEIVTLRERRPTSKTDDGENEDPSWAPDSKHLVFMSTRSRAAQLWVLDIESGRVRQLTHSAGSKQPAWSPYLGGRR